MAEPAASQVVAETPPPTNLARRQVGAGRVLSLIYGFFSLASGARSLVQLTTHASRAPLAYGLSAAAAAVYLVGTVVITRADRTGRGRGLTVLLCSIELTGVMIVGLLSILMPAAFPDATVWSRFGSGYGYVPAALPILGLIWTRHHFRVNHPT